MREILIKTEPIELYKILKLDNIVASGGEAKYFISQGKVTVNNKIEMRKRKKIVSKDIIGFNNEKICVKLLEK